MNEIIFAAGNPAQAWVKLNDVVAAMRIENAIHIRLRAANDPIVFQYLDDDQASTAFAEMLRGIGQPQQHPEEPSAS